MTRFPLKFMKEKEAATNAAVPFHWCTLLELITSITMSPSLQMNMNCHVHVLLSECMLALLASAWNVHRPERSHCASSSCDFSQSQIFVTYSHTGRNETLALVLIQRWRLQLRALALYFQSQVYFPCPRYYHSGNKMDRNWFQKKDSSTSSFS